MTSAGGVGGRACRAMIVLLAVALLVPAGARADAAGDERYLRLEHAERFYALMAPLAQMQGPIIEVADRRELPALAARGTKAAAQIYAPAPAMAAMRAALGQVMGDVPPELGAIADRMAAAEHDILDHPLAELQAREPRLRAHYEARSDRATIDSVSNAMAATELASEVAVTGLRVKAIYEAVLTGDRDELRTMTPEQIDAGVHAMLDGARAPDPGQSGMPFRKDFARDQQRMFKRSVLSQLSPMDVAILARFYDSATGQAKRAALLASFRRLNDDAGDRLIMAFMRPLLVR